MLLEKIEELLKEVNALTAQNAEEVEQLRIKYLSKKGEINALMADFRNVPGDQKKEVGIKINELKNAALEKINGLKEQMEEAESSSDDIDLTRTAYPVALRPPSIDRGEESDHRHLRPHGIHSLPGSRGR